MGLDIIGASFDRTATMSLKVALVQLGCPCYHIVKYTPKKRPEHWKLWDQVGNGAPDWYTIFEDLPATVGSQSASSWSCPSPKRHFRI